MGDPAPPMPPGPSPALLPEEPDVVEAYSFNTGVMVLLMILWSSCGHHIAARTKYVGEWGAACLLGLGTGQAILILQRYLTADAVHQLLTFNPADFFTYLLPPIIFYAGLSVKKKHFFKNFGIIAAFGILGTYIAFAIIALVLFGLAQLPNILNLSDSLALGVIFAATDSVAVLQVLRQDKAPLLYSICFGEGVINDATAVALLRAVQELREATTGKVQGHMVASVLSRFLYLFAASTALGLGFGLGSAFLMKRIRSSSVPQEVALLGLLGYLSYLTGDYLGLSGIVTLFCCAVAISHYALHNVSAPARVTLVRAFQTLSYVAEGTIFIYVGMDTLDPLKWMNTYWYETVWLFCVLLFLTMLGRAAFVFPFSLAHNRLVAAAADRLSFKEMVVIWWAGLIRGAVSVALVYYYFDPYGQSEDPHRATIIATTLVVVLFSIMVFGALTKPLLHMMLGEQVRGRLQDPKGGSNLQGLLPNGHSHSNENSVTLRPDRLGPGFGDAGFSPPGVVEDPPVTMRRNYASFESLAVQESDDGLDPSRMVSEHQRLLAKDAADYSSSHAPHVPWYEVGARGTASDQGAPAGIPPTYPPGDAAGPSSIEMMDATRVGDPFGESAAAGGRESAAEGAYVDRMPDPASSGRHPSHPGRHLRPPDDPPGPSGAPGPSGLDVHSSSLGSVASSRQQAQQGLGRGVHSAFEAGDSPRGQPLLGLRPPPRAPSPSPLGGWTGLEERGSGTGEESARGPINQWWTHFDAKYMQPVFGGPELSQHSHGALLTRRVSREGREGREGAVPRELV